MRVRHFGFPILVLVLAFAPVSRCDAADRIQRSIAAIEAFTPVAFLLTQGTETPFELLVFGASVGLHTIPNTVLLLGEASGRAKLTRTVRWINFGIDAATAAGLVGVGITYLSGGFGPAADLRLLGGAYLALSLPAGIAAFADFLPYSIEEGLPARDAPAAPTK